MNLRVKVKFFLSLVLTLFLTCSISIYAKDSNDYLNTSEYNIKEKIKAINPKDYPDAS